MLETIRPVYIDYIPKQLEFGVLYISNKYKTASHLCCCGCGTKIVTPLRNTEYRLTVKGNLVSLKPSIGNWNHPCQSHYWILDNQITWAEKMSKDEIRIGRAHDEILKDMYFDTVALPWWRRYMNKIHQWRSNLFK